MNFSGKEASGLLPKILAVRYHYRTLSNLDPVPSLQVPVFTQCSSLLREAVPIPTSVIPTVPIPTGAIPTSAIPTSTPVQKPPGPHISAVNFIH